MEPRLRQAVRGLIIDPDWRMLLVRFAFPDWQAWATPGGGIEPGEDPLDALRRELAEEVGLTGAQIGPPVWRREHVFDMGDWDGQSELVYLIRTERFDPHPQMSWDELHSEHVDAIRWWSREDLVETGVTLIPSNLVALVHRIRDDGVPATPLSAAI